MPSGSSTKGIYRLSYIYDIVSFVGEMPRSYIQLMKIKPHDSTLFRANLPIWRDNCILLCYVKLYGGYRVKASYILNYRKMIIIFTSPPQKNSWYLFNRRLDEFPGKGQKCDHAENNASVIQTHSHTLYQLHYHDSLFCPP